MSTRTVVSAEGLSLADIACRHPAGRGHEDERSESHAIVFVRRGCFVRNAEGADTLLDPTSAFCINPGQEFRYDHPHDGGDDCTSVFLSPELAASLWGGDPGLPTTDPLPVSPAVDLEHRLLLAAARRGADDHELIERSLALTAATLEHADRRRVSSARPTSARARRMAVDQARQALAEDPDRSLLDLARASSVSPHHLSRVFRSAMGHTISRHRMRLRARIALERLAGGERDLARLAADVGFVDQSHLCRIIRGETGRTPAALRAALGA